MRVLVIGSGKMARDAARTALGAGCDVTVASRDAERLAACLRHLRREVRRLEASGGPVGEVRGLLAGETPEDPFDLLFETVEEDAEAKRAVLETWLPHRAPEGLVVTNSSSLLPWEIHPEALGLHLFYPSTLTGFCEAILPEGCDGSRRERLEALAVRLGLRPIVEVGMSRAQAINRLLLPGQAWAVRAARRGLAPERVDDAFEAAWPGWRPLAMMEAVGLETIARSVASYRLRMDPAEARSCEELEVGVRDRIRLGRWGPPDGQALPAGEPESLEDLSRDAEALCLGTCRRAVDSGVLREDHLAVALSGLFGAPWPPPGLREREAAWRERRAQRWRETGWPWWRPWDGPEAGA